MKTVVFSILLTSFAYASGQNTIKVRKSDTTFNAFYYSEDKVNSVDRNKGRSYYILREDGAVFFFNNTSNFKKFKKHCDEVYWTRKKHPDGKYYIKGSEILIFPYIMDKSGKKVLGATSLNGTYHANRLVISSGSNDRVMIKLE